MAQKKKKPARTSQDRLRTIVAEYGVRGAARKLGIDRRTVQRQLNQGQQATKTAGKIVQESARVRQAHVRAAKQAGIKLPRGVTLRAIRTSRIDPSDPKRKRRVRGYSVRFDIKHMKIGDIADFLLSFRGQSRAWYVVKQAFKDYKTPDCRVQAGDRAASRRYDLDANMFKDAGGLRDVLASEFINAKPIFLVITDPIK